MVVEVVKSRGVSPPKYKLVYEMCQLKNVYARSYINLITNATIRLMDWEEAYKSWQGLSKITEHEADRSTSNIGG